MLAMGAAAASLQHTACLPLGGRGGEGEGHCPLDTVLHRIPTASALLTRSSGASNRRFSCFM